MLEQWAKEVLSATGHDFTLWEDLRSACYCPGPSSMQAPGLLVDNTGGLNLARQEPQGLLYSGVNCHSARCACLQGCTRTRLSERSNGAREQISGSQ